MKRTALLFVSSLSIAAAVAQTKIESTSSTTTAGSTTKTSSTVSTPVTSNVSVGVTSTTTYDQPGKGADGPIPGNQRGSSTNTTTGPSVTIKY